MSFCLWQSALGKIVVFVSSCVQEKPDCVLADSSVMEAVREQKQQERHKVADEEVTEEVYEEVTEKGS